MDETGVDNPVAGSELFSVPFRRALAFSFMKPIESPGGEMVSISIAEGAMIEALWTSIWKENWND